MKSKLQGALPVIGIVAFSLCSVWSLYHLFTANATHPTPLYWLAAGLVELLTAWTVYQLVEQVRTLTRSNLSKQDRRFYRVIAVAFLLVALPTLGTSVWANAKEFDNLVLGLLFPVASIGCAISAALPQTVANYRNQRASERQEEKAERNRKERERKQKQAQEQASARHAQDFDNLVASLGKAGETLRLYVDNPMQSQASVAQALGISRQAVGQHLSRLEQEGLVKRNGKGVEIVGVSR